MGFSLSYGSEYGLFILYCRDIQLVFKCFLKRIIVYVAVDLVYLWDEVSVKSFCTYTALHINMIYILFLLNQN